MRVKYILLHYADLPRKELIRHKFLKDDFSKSNQRYSTKSQSVGTKTRIKIYNRFCPKHNHDFFSWLLSSKTLFPRLVTPSWSVICLVRCFSNYYLKEKRSNRFKRFNSVDTNKFQKFRIENFTNLKAALSSYQTTHRCLVFRGVNYGLVFDWVTLTYFCYKEILNFWTTMIFQSFHLLNQ